MTRDKLMPPALRLGQRFSMPIGELIRHWREELTTNEIENQGSRSVMGLKLPTWQRPIVWDEERQVRFVESVWLGLDLGTYSLNMIARPGAEFDKLLIDGQQRIFSLQRYFSDEFPIFGYRWSEVTEIDRREMEMSRIFARYETRSEDEQYLRDYYNRMNFGGVAHTEDQRA